MLKTNLTTLVILSLTTLGACAIAQDDIGSTDDAVRGRPAFEVFRGDDNRFYFHLEASNHEIILASQGYSSRTNALGGVLSVLDNAGTTDAFRLEEAADGTFYFNLVAPNNEIIGTSETYSSRGNARSGIDSVIENVGDYLAFRAARRGARFVVFEGDDGRYFFQLRAQNGEIVLQSQGYSSEAAAMNGTFSVAENGIDRDAYDLKPSGETGYYFNIVAANGQVIGTSEVYSTKSNAVRACEDIIAFLPSVELL